MKKHLIFCIAIFTIIFCIKFYISYLKFNQDYSEYKNGGKILVFVIRKEEVTDEKVSYLVKLKKVEYSGNKYLDYDQNFILNIYINKFSSNISNEVFFEKYNYYKYGDILNFSGDIKIPEKLNNPYEFNYKRYLNSKNIYGTITTYSVNKSNEINGNIIYKLIYVFKAKIALKLSERLPDNEAQLLKSMVYGDDIDLSKEIKAEFKNIGISHLIAVSGSNITTLIIILYVILDSINFKTKLRTILTIFILILFCLIANAEVSILRATIMAILVLFFKLYNLKSNKYFSIIISGVIILILNPYSIFNISFILSYLATLSIIMFFRPISSYIDVKLKHILKYNTIYLNTSSKISSVKKITYSVLSKINVLFALTISSQILIFPVQIYCFNLFALATFLSNIIIVAVSTVEQILGFLSISLILIPYVSDIVINSNFVILRIIIVIARFLDNLNLPVIKLASPNLLTILSYYILIYCSLINENLKFKLNKEKLYLNFKIIGIKKILYFSKYQCKKFINIISIICIINIIGYYIYVPYFESYVYYFNVGQGNMAIVKKHNTIAIFDCGSTSKNLAGKIMRDFLKAKAIENIDIIVLSHMHDDHVNGISEISENIKIKSIAYSLPKQDNLALFEQVKSVAYKFNIATLELSQFDTINVNNEIWLDILLPFDNYSVTADNDLNANSTVTLIKTKTTNMLFLGDATNESEKQLFKLMENINNEKFKSDDIKTKLANIDIVQIGHHGSKTSTSEYLFKLVNFKNAIISSKKKVYGHPAKETLDILKKYNKKVNVTEEVGAIKFNI